jgi:hypothetical protein
MSFSTLGPFGRMFVAAVLQAAYATFVGYDMDMQCAMTPCTCVIGPDASPTRSRERAFPVVVLVAPPWRSGVVLAPCQ